MLKGLRLRLAAIFTIFTGAVLAGVLGVSLYFALNQTVHDRQQWFSSTVDTVSSMLLAHDLTGEAVSLYADPYIVSIWKDGEPFSYYTTGETVPAGVQFAVRGTTELTSAQQQTLFTETRRQAAEQELESWYEGNFHVSMGSALAPLEDTTAPAGSTGAAGATADGGAADDSGVAANRTAGSTGAGAAVGPDEPLTEEHIYSGSTIYPGMVAIAMMSSSEAGGTFTAEIEGQDYRAIYFEWEMGSADAGTLYEVSVLENLAGQRRNVAITSLVYAALFLAGLGLLFAANWFLAKLVLRPTEAGLRRQTEFVAAASHELRSPLAVIRSSLSAAEASADEAQAAKYQNAAADEAERMGHLVDDLLLLAGGDAGGLTLDEGMVDVDTLLIAASEVYQPLARQKDVGLVLALPEATLPQVAGDAERLRQILGVLLDNALQYAPAGTDVTLSAAAKRGKLRITVADRGRGIPDEEKDKVFHRFYRAEKSRHDKSHFGLGLSVAKELAELHGGSLDVADTRGGGASFRLTLPCA